MVMPVLRSTKYGSQEQLMANGDINTHVVGDADVIFVSTTPRSKYAE